MQITAGEAKTARAKLGFSQAAVCKATGIPRNIMSAFEQKKIVLLDDMQETLFDFYASEGLTDSEIEAANDADAEFGLDENVNSSSWPHDGGLIVRDGFRIPSGLVSDSVDSLLENVHEVETEIEALSRSELEQDSLLGFFSTGRDDNKEALQRLTMLHARWACLVRQIYGRSSAVLPANSEEMEQDPSTHGEAMSQWLTKEFGFAADVAE